jgi:ketosteroid isomerase-like protein
MKSALLVVLFAIIPLGCHSSASMESGARGAVKRYTDALVKKDVAALEKLWGDDLIFINPRGQIQTKSQRLADIRSGATAIKSIDLQDVSVKSSGRHVLCITRGKVAGTYGGKDMTAEYAIQMALSRDGKDWHIHTIQLTPILP